MTATKLETPLTGEEALTAFWAAYHNGLCHVWAYSPNGGVGNATGVESFHTRERLAELIGSAGDWDSVAFDGTKLELGNRPARSVHQYYTIDLSQRHESEGRLVVACRGSGYGREWGSSCDEIDTYELSRALKSFELLDLIVDHHDEIGLEAVNDPTDDGDNFAIADETKFLSFATAANALVERINFDDSDDLLAFAKRVVAGEPVESLALEIVATQE